MVTSEIYTEQLRPEHAQAVSRNSSRIMFACMCRCADASVRQKKRKGEVGMGGGSLARREGREAEGEKGGRMGRGETENIR